MTTPLDNIARGIRDRREADTTTTTPAGAAFTGLRDLTAAGTASAASLARFAKRRGKTGAERIDGVIIGETTTTTKEN